MISLTAESYWKIAKAQEILGEHLKAAENFEELTEGLESVLAEAEDFSVIEFEEE